ncbi:MAG: DUF1189 domain-containing protein [Clostridium sartagoforme]|nr:DUF1189 domain-containing protein [Clostridium sartagoforme]
MNGNISFIKKIRISIGSIEGYRDLIKEKISRAIIYSILLSLIIGGIQGTVSFIVINSVQKTMEKVISSDEFKFTLQDGILNFENSPIKSEEGRTIVYIDTDISLEDVDSIRNIVVHKDVSIAVLRDGVSFRVNGEEYNYSFSDVPIVGKIDNEMLLKSLGLIGIAKYIAFISAILVTYIIFMVNTLILSILGVIINKLNNLRLSYGSLFKISVYAMTLPSLIGLIIPIGVFGFIISTIYLIVVTNYLRNNM